MKLNLGCGNDYMTGFVNVDMGSCKCDVSHDLGVFPWPFEESTVDEVVLKHIFEHFNPEDFIKISRELYRICKDTATIHILSPHAGSNNYWTDPTHKMPLTARTFDFFDRDKALFENGVIYGWDDVNFSVDAKVLDNPPNGPDIYHILKVNK